MDWHYWAKKVEENIKKAEIESSKFEEYDEDYYKEARYEVKSEDKAIDDLFTKTE